MHRNVHGLCDALGIDCNVGLSDVHCDRYSDALKRTHSLGSRYMHRDGNGYSDRPGGCKPICDGHVHRDGHESLADLHAST